MKDIAFVIYGASSDIVSSIFEEFYDSTFISLINKTKPGHIKGEIINTNDKDYLATLSNFVESIDSSKTLVYINAAVYQKDELFISHQLSEIEKMIDVGISKNLYITQILLAEMLKRRKGRIINLSSFRAFAPTKGTSVYSAIKSFTNTLSKGLGLEYGRFDITSNTISIGFAESKLLDSIKDDKLLGYKKSISKNKFLPSKEFTDCIKFIIQSAYMNSAILDLEGGISFLE